MHPLRSTFPRSFNPDDAKGRRRVVSRHLSCVPMILRRFTACRTAPIVCAGLMLLCMVSPAWATYKHPYTPASDDVVLETLPSTSDARVRQFTTLRRTVAAKPGDIAGAVALANSYLDYGRDTGDARYLGRAQAVIAPAMQRRPVPVDVLLVQATILQSRHQFDESQRMLKDILARDRDNMQAWLTLSSVALVQGDMAGAQRACSHLIGSADALVTAGCIGSRATVGGDAATALHLIATLLAQEPNEPPAIQSWAHGLLADAAKYLGHDARADAEFKRALALAPGDNFLLADYADFLLDRGRAREALALVKDYSQSDTSFLRQVLAESALGLPAARADTATMASRFNDLEQRGDSRLYGREEARFVLHLQHDADRALRLAQDNWRIQRAPEDMRVYLEAALAAGRPAAAQPVVEFVRVTGFEDPTVRALAARVTRAVDTSAMSRRVAP